MSEPGADTAPQESWLDTWLSEVAKADSMRLRANAAIALATLGGPARIEEFIDLVGDTALLMKRGRPGAAETIATALREVEREDFDRDALTRAFERDRRDRPDREAARALLMPAHPAVAWWRLRSVSPWAGWWRTLTLTFQHALGSMAILLVAMALIIDAKGGLNILVGGDNSGKLLLVFGLAVVGPLLLARIAVAGQRTPTGLVLDGLFCGAIGASPLLPVAVLTASAHEPGVGFYWLLYAAVVVAIAAVRIFVGVTPAGRRSLPTTLSVIAWPVVLGTAAALATAWWLGGRDGDAIKTQQEALCWTWVTFVVAAAPLAAAIGAAEAFRRMTVSPFLVFRLPNPAVLLVTLFVVVVVPILSVARGAAQTFDVGPERVSGPFTVTNDERFELKVSRERPPGGVDDKVELAFDRESADFVFEADGGYREVDGVTKKATPPYEEVASDAVLAGPAVDAAATAADAAAAAADAMDAADAGPPPPGRPVGDRFDSELAMPSMTPLGRHFTLDRTQTERLCMVQRGNRRCGVPTVALESWLRVLTGRTASLGDHKDLHFYVYRATPPKAVNFPVKAAWLEAWRTNPNQRFTLPMSPTPESPALQIRSPEHLYLKVKPQTDDAIRDRVVVVQLEDRVHYQVWSSDDPDPPQMSLRLQPDRTYLVCVRMIHAVFLDCLHQTRGLLAEPIELTLTKARPPEVILNEAEASSAADAVQQSAGPPLAPKPPPPTRRRTR